jgi:hypothetical protein
MTILIPSSQIQFDFDKDVTLSIPEETEVNIDNMQLEINCGFNMYNKKLKIKIQAEEQEFELPVVTLSQMYRLQVSVDLPENKKGNWEVKNIVITPCQKNNYPVFISVISKND